MSEIRHLVVDSGLVTEVNYLLSVDGGEPVPVCSRAQGHLSTVEMMLWIERQRTKARELASAASRPFGG